MDSINTKHAMQTTRHTLDDASKATGVDNPASVAIDSSASDSSQVSESEEASSTGESQEAEEPTEELRCCECKVVTNFQGDLNLPYCIDCGHEQCEECGPLIFMDCCKCPQLTEINANFDYCGRHRHEFCGNCRHWDPNEDEELHLDLKKKIEENDDSDEDYVIENTEANKKALIPMNALLEPVAPEVTDELELTAAEVVAKLKLFERITNLIPELQRMILSSFLSNVKPRDVRVIWDHFRQQWTYRCFSGFGTNSFANTIPAMVWNASGNSRVAATNFFDPAPTFGDLEPYRYFNFDQDQLVLDYRRCGNTSRDTREYSRAMYNAATALVEHHNNPGAPQLRFLTFTWCPETDNPRGILSILNGITSLERVIVEAHDHYDDPITNYRNATGRYQRDEKEMEYFSTRLGTYHFEVEFINHWGVSCKAEESEEELEQEDDGYEVDDDFWVPDWG